MKNNATHTANSATTIPSGRARPTEMPGAGDSAENRDADSSCQLNRGGGRLGEAECTNKQAPRKGNRSSGLGFVTPSAAHRAPRFRGRSLQPARALRPSPPQPRLRGRAQAGSTHRDKRDAQMTLLQPVEGGERAPGEEPARLGS